MSCDNISDFHDIFVVTRRNAYTNFCSFNERQPGHPSQFWTHYPPSLAFLLLCLSKKWLCVCVCVWVKSFSICLFVVAAAAALSKVFDRPTIASSWHITASSKQERMRKHERENINKIARVGSKWLFELHSVRDFLNYIYKSLPFRETKKTHSETHNNKI